MTIKVAIKNLFTFGKCVFIGIPLCFTFGCVYAVGLTTIIILLPIEFFIFRKDDYCS